MKDRLLTLGLIIFCMIALNAGPAYADIAGFEFGGLTTVGDFTLNTRIGKLSTNTDHVINMTDCATYQGHSIELHWSLNLTPLAGTTYAVKMSQPGGSCSTTDLSDIGTTCYSDFLVSEKNLDSTTDNTFYIPMDPMMGGDCNADTDKVVNVYILLNQNGAISAQTISFDVDLQPPSAPVITKIEPGNTSLTVDWEDSLNAGEENLTYKVYWCPQAFTNSTKANCKASDDLTAMSYQISGLENNKTYYVGVTANDEHDNEGLLSELDSDAPVVVKDFFQYYKSSGGKADGDFCFIATAAWGTKSAHDVVILRHFRDVFLRTNPVGRWFIRTYYTLSPPIARFISHSEILRAVVRIMLKPFVFFARLSLKYHTLTLFLMLFGLLAISSSIVLLARKR